MTNNIEKKLTSTEIIIDEIANTILSGELKPGDKLLTEREFAEKYHVTRSCVREAIRSLSLIGMIEIRLVEAVMSQMPRKRFRKILYYGCIIKIFMNMEIFIAYENW